MANLVKISEGAAVNPKHVLLILRDKGTLKTKVLLGGGVVVDSDHIFEKTVELLQVKGDE